MSKQKYIDAFLRQALDEDIGNGDHSSNCSIPAEQVGRMQLLAKDDGVLAGLHHSLRVFELIDPAIEAEAHKSDKDLLKQGEIVCTLEGNSRNLLMGERLFLNLLQRMCGIATKTSYLNSLIVGTSAKLLDTRKTTPNMRYFEKYAVTAGGGVNHRMGLYDMIMLKDNHIDFAGGIRPAIQKAKDYLENKGMHIPIEVETRNLGELEEVLEFGGVQRIMLDNFSVANTVIAVNMIGNRFETESSGGIDEHTIRAYAETGVNFISVGALTHSVKSLDLSLKAI